jgi:periplasmic protein TonB
MYRPGNQSTLIRVKPQQLPRQNLAPPAICFGAYSAAGMALAHALHVKRMDRPSRISGPLSPTMPKSQRRRLAAARVRRLRPAILASVMLHLLLAACLVRFVRKGPSEPSTNPQGTVELLMVEKRGEPTPPAQTSNQATPSPPAPPSMEAAASQPQQPAPSPQTRPDATERGEAAAPTIASEEGGEKVPLPAQDDVEPREAVQDQATKPATAKSVVADATAVPAHTPAPAPPRQVPVFNLSGTDSESNAIVMGEHVIPASPDDRFRNRPPIYPNDAAVRGQQGEVVVVIHVGENGVSAGADVAETSGVASLDRAALDAVRKWHFRPAMKDGRTVPFDMPMRFIFEFN